MESPSLEVFKRPGCDTKGLCVSGWWLGLMIWKIFPDLDNSMITCSIVPSLTQYFVCLVSTRIDYSLFQLYSFTYLHLSFMHLYTGWNVICRRIISSTRNPGLFFLWMKFHLLPSSWLTVNYHTQCTDKKDASVFVVIGWDYTAILIHTQKEK